MEGAEPLGDTIYLIDELEIVPGQLDGFLKAFERDYRPGAESRGQRLLQRLVTPPIDTGRLADLPPVAQSVLLIWELDGLAGFWGMRSQNATAEVAEWWREAGAFFVSRSRRFAASPEAVATFETVGRMNA